MSMSEPVTRKRFYLSRADEYRVTRFLEERIVRHADGTASYADGWSDGTVVEQMQIAGMQSGHVGAIRRAIFGNLPERPVDRSKDDRLADLEMRMARLEKELGLEARLL